MTGLRHALGLPFAAAFLAAAAVVLPSAPAQAQPQTIPKHVAVVVTGIGMKCVDVGGTGLDVLARAYKSSTWNPAGFVLTINGRGTTHPDDTHYWSYWHQSGNGWVYSTMGGASTHPAAGSVEGWSYVDGQQSASPPPAASYMSICAGKDPTVAPPHPTVTPTPTHHATHTTSRYIPPAPNTSARGTSSKAKESARSSTHPSPIPTTHPPSAGPSASAVALRAAPPRASSTQHSGLPPWGTALAIVVVAVLGGAAFWRTRAQRRGSP